MKRDDEGMVAKQSSIYIWDYLSQDVGASGKAVFILRWSAQQATQLYQNTLRKGSRKSTEGLQSSQVRMTELLP